MSLIQFLSMDSLCGLPVFLWLIVILLLAVIIGMMGGNPPRGIPPPDTLPGHKNIKTNKKRSKRHGI